MRLYNTLTKQIEELKPLKAGQVSLYTCGPTVYNFAHIGNLRTYIFEDLLQRALQFSGYQVDRAMNITDVGHLVGDGDEGEDKLEVGAKREGKSPLEIAKFYTDKFLLDLKELNIIEPAKILAASDSIAEQIEIIKILEQKGFVYSGEKAVYFDTTKLSDYGKLSGQKLADKKTGAREEVVMDPDKKTPADFALWFFLKGKYEHHILHWPSPWGTGFPGWHIECSAISRKLLGQPFDIHTGGVDHIGTHHANEIAQSEAAFGVPLANVWMHGEFLQIDAKRMGKSEGNFLTLDTIKAKGFSPLDFRYMCLQAHYRTQLNFTWETLKAAQTARYRLNGEVMQNFDRTEPSAKYLELFSKALDNDLNVPQALALSSDLFKDQTLSKDIKISTLLKFDDVFGLGLRTAQDLAVEDLPEEITSLIKQRDEARTQKDFKKSDELRKQMEDLGYEVKDTAQGQSVKKK